MAAEISRAAGRVAWLSTCSCQGLRPSRCTR